MISYEKDLCAGRSSIWRMGCLVSSQKARGATDRPFIWNCLGRIRGEIATVERYARNGLRLRLALRSIVNAARDVRTSVSLSLLLLIRIFCILASQQPCESRDIWPYSRSNL